MKNEMTIEQYLQRFYPRILDQYYDYTAEYINLKPEEVCALTLDTSKLARSAANALAYQGIITVGQLLRVLHLHKNLKWVSGVGKATWDRLYYQLSPYGINISRLSDTDEDILNHAIENCKRYPTTAINNMFAGSIAKDLLFDGIKTAYDLIWKTVNEDNWIAGQDLCLRNKVAEFAPDWDSLIKEFRGKVEVGACQLK